MTFFVVTHEIQDRKILKELWSNPSLRWMRDLCRNKTIMVIIIVYICVMTVLSCVSLFLTTFLVQRNGI